MFVAVKLAAIDRFLLDRSGLERLGIGTVSLVVSTMLARGNLGPMTRISAVFLLVGIVFVFMSVEPPLTRALGGEGWNDLGFARQMVVLLLVVAFGAAFVTALIFTPAVVGNVF